MVINYERVFEMSNLTTEMISGVHNKIGTTKVFSMINNFDGAKLGKIFMMFAKPIELK